MAQSASLTAHIDTFCRDNLPPTEQWPLLEFTLPELQYPQHLNCATALLDRTIARHGADRPCLIGDGDHWSYGDLQRHANQIAHVLTQDLGLVPGGRVLLRGANTPWLAACWFAVLKAGGVVVTTMPLLRTAELRPLIELTQTGIALCDKRLAAALAGTAGGPTLRCFGAGDAQDLKNLAADKPVVFDDVETASDDVALLAPTSGTTGSPKATMQFHRDVMAVCDTFSRHILKPTADDVFTGTPPLAFTFGLGGLLLFPLHVGASVVLLERPDEASLIAAIEEHSATIMFTAPTGYRSILSSGHAQALGQLRRAVSAGEHLPASVWHGVYDQTGLVLIDGIGGTEMMHVYIGCADDAIRPGSTGRVVPGYRAEILDFDGNSVTDGQPGRLAVVGPTGCRYLADSRQTDYVQNGWNITGDTYIRDRDGYFWFQARNDDMIISAGYNIPAPAVEQALNQHADVAECAVIGIPDTERGAIVHAAVVLRDGVAADDAKRTELQRFVKNTIAPYQYPRSLAFHDGLPRTPSGKIQRYRLKQEMET